MSAARVFTIPAGAPFLPTLADAILSGELVGPLDPDALSEATIYLPSRRAVASFATILADRAGRALLLPRIVPLGDAEEDPREGMADLPPAITPLERRLILTRLVQAWAEQVERQARETGAARMLPTSPADAIRLAADLEALMDAIATEGADWKNLADRVEAEHSAYFAMTLDFVRIAHEAWPAILAARGASDPARRRNAILDAEARRLVTGPPAGPVIAAGSTGSIPATARLLGAIATLPRGAVVLPGLDLDLDERGWDAIGRDGDEDGGVHGHPQFILRRLLRDHLALDRASVRVLAPQARSDARRRLLSEVMRPAETTDAWAEARDMFHFGLVDEGTAGIALIEAADEREEALAAAIALRETLSRPGATAALVTPDRRLAQRVTAELGRWGVSTADSAGIPLSDTAPGRLARLAADAAALQFHPVAVLALLAHPDVTLGLPREAVEASTAALEIGVLRGPAPRPGLAGLEAALAARRKAAESGRSRHDPLPRSRLGREDWRGAADLVGRLAAAFSGFPPDPAATRPLDLVALAQTHARTVADLARAGPHHDGPQGPAWSALDELFEALALTRVEDGQGRPLEGRLADYPAVFTTLARERVLPPETAGAHPRVQILGLLEARLLDVDRVVLAGLDETIWPPVAETDAFLNRPMRLRLGLTPPERRIGQTAHDFVQALGTRDAVVTRARKRDGKPTVPSRFLERLRAFAGDGPWKRMIARGNGYLDLAARLDAPRRAAPPVRPAPRPGGARFPRRLSVTEIETLVRDPYAIYAKHVLRLDPLDAIAVLPGAADRGTILHDILSDFVLAFPGDVPSDAEAHLLRIGRERFGDVADAYPELHALWWPAFGRLVPAYLEWERRRRAARPGLHVERSGRIEIPVAEGDVFTLSARADRIEVGTDAAAIVDFKTGSVPTDRVVCVGFSPQLTLEAAMLTAGGFKDVPAPGGLPGLDYVKIGGRNVLETRSVKPPKGDKRSLARIVEEHRRGLEETVRRFATEDAGYVSRPYSQYARRYAPYDHLARVREWSVLALETEE